MVGPAAVENTALVTFTGMNAVFSSICEENTAIVRVEIAKAVFSPAAPPPASGPQRLEVAAQLLDDRADPVGHVADDLLGVHATRLPRVI